MNAVSPPLQPPLPGAPLPPTPSPSTCPPPPPFESHPRHHAAPPVFPKSDASCGAESFQHAGRKARTDIQRAPRENYSIFNPCPQRRHSAPSVSAPATAPTAARKRTLPSAATPDAQRNGSRYSRGASSKGARRRALALPSLGRNRLRASLARWRGSRVSGKTSARSIDRPQMRVAREQHRTIEHGAFCENQRVVRFLIRQQPLCADFPRDGVNDAVPHRHEIHGRNPPISTRANGAPFARRRARRLHRRTR